MLKVIDGHKAEHEAKKKSPQWYLDRYANMAMRRFASIEQGDKEQLPAAVFCAVRHFNYAHGCDSTDVRTQFRLALNAQMFMEYLTPTQFLQTFPPSKTYDGAKWESIDYYSTMAKFKDVPMDVPLGESGVNMNKLLFGYDNRDLMNFSVNLMMIVSRLHRADTGRDILDDFMESQGKPPLNKYHLQTDSNGKQYIVDEHGRTHKIRKAKPRYLRVVE